MTHHEVKNVLLLHGYLIRGSSYRYVSGLRGAPTSVDRCFWSITLDCGDEPTGWMVKALKVRAGVRSERREWVEDVGGLVTLLSFWGEPL